MSEQSILYALEDGVAKITLNRPDRLNSFNPDMHLALRAALERAGREARAVLLTGAGRGFCAGQDLSDRSVAADEAPPDIGASIDLYYKPLILQIKRLPMPVVCAVNGVAAGAGVSVALACDMVFAAKSASFIQAFSKIGLIPDAGGSWFLVERLGLARALALAMTGDKLPAVQAKEWGMIWDVADDPLAAALAMAEKLSVMPTRALVATRHLLRDGATRTLHQQLDAERDAQAAMGHTHDYIEGVMAFLEKRTAQFKGE